MIVERTITIKNKQGLHARPAALFVQTANKFNCDISITKSRHKVNGKSIMGIITLGAAYKTKLAVIADGNDELEATEAIVKLFESRFEEE